MPLYGGGGFYYYKFVAEDGRGGGPAGLLVGSLGQSYPSGYSDPVNPSAAYGLGDIPWGYPGDKIEVLSREELMQEVGYHPPDPEPPQNAPDPVLAQPLPPGLPIVTSSGEIEASPALTAILSDDYGVHIIDGLIYHYDAESQKWHQYTESEFREKYRAWEPDGTQRTDATQAGTSLVGRVRGAVAGLGQQVGSAINTIKGSLGIGNIRAVPKSKIGQAAYVASEWYKGVALQGPANIANGVQDGVVGLINFPGAIANTVASSVDYVFGADSVDPLRIPYLSSSDWAYGKFTPESQGLHDVSKIAGGFGAELLAGGWLSKIAQTFRGLSTTNSGAISPGGVANYIDALGGTLSPAQQQFLKDLATRYPAGSTARMMAEGVRNLKPGETVIGFMTRDGKLIGELADPRIGHAALADLYPHLLSRLRSGDAIAITLYKMRDGTIKAFGSGTFEPPGGTLSGFLQKLAERLAK